MTMRDTKKGPIGDKFKEVGKTIRSRLIRNEKAQELKKEAKWLGFKNKEARDLAKRYRRDELTPNELAEIGAKWQTKLPHTTGGNNAIKLSYEDAKAISHFGNQDKYGRSKAEQVYDQSKGITPPTEPEPLDNPVAKGKND